MTAEQTIIALLLQRVAELEQENLRDALTNCLNKRALLQLQTSGEVSVIAIDVPGVGALNLKNGHTWVDGYLREIGEILREAVRKTDCVYRFGGDEFCIVLDACDLDKNILVAFRIHEQMPDLYIGASTGTDLQVVIKEAFGKVERQKRARSKKYVN